MPLLGIFYIKTNNYRYFYYMITPCNGKKWQNTNIYFTKVKKIIHQSKGDAKNANQTLLLRQTNQIHRYIIRQIDYRSKKIRQIIFYWKCLRNTCTNRIKKRYILILSIQIFLYSNSRQTICVHQNPCINNWKNILSIWWNSWSWKLAKVD